MRNIVFPISMMSAAVALSACSETAEETAAPAAEGEMAATETAMEGERAASGEVLDASTATTEQLVAAGLSRETADRIVAGQPYDSVVNLNAALPADEASHALKIVFVPVNLNSASREEIALIPGMTDRMIVEFLEYRPYEDMAEFDREIGKYVDETEVERFRRYVTL